jgi:hypothetical protein
MDKIEIDDDNDSDGTIEPRVFTADGYWKVINWPTREISMDQCDMPHIDPRSMKFLETIKLKNVTTDSCYKDSGLLDLTKYAVRSLTMIGCKPSVRDWKPSWKVITGKTLNYLKVEGGVIEIIDTRRSVDLNWKLIQPDKVKALLSIPTKTPFDLTFLDKIEVNQ